MIDKLIDKLIARAKRTPYFHLEGYMMRYWLIPYNRFFPAARIHHILRSDDDRAFHDHPWPYVSIVLRGGYYEVTPNIDKSGIYLGEKFKWYGPGSVIFRSAKSWHRLVIPNKGQTAWTLFITGKYQQTWGFFLNANNKVPYRKYLGMESENG